jgi:predicted transcriptional regulator of viral defense system
MNYPELRNLKDKLYFRVDEVAENFRITQASARVLCSRYFKKGLFVRLKKDFYLLTEKWENLSANEFFKLANFLQVPSYISFLTALAYYEITTQIPRYFFESVSLRRSKRISLNQVIFNYYKIKKDYYSGFRKINGVFMALPEKALVDALYLLSLGRYSLDISSLDIGKINPKKIKQIARSYPQRTKRLVFRICKI